MIFTSYTPQLLVGDADKTGIIVGVGVKNRINFIPFPLHEP
jgi:hypothetical protein